MQGSTFRDGLAARGCRFELHERGHGRGQAIVTVEREGRATELPMVGSHQRLDPAVVRDVGERLGLDWNELPGPKGLA